MAFASDLRCPVEEVDDAPLLCLWLLLPPSPPEEDKGEEEDGDEEVGKDAITFEFEFELTLEEGEL
jgi:hypothetical protein